MNFREGAVSETFIVGTIVCVRCLFPLLRTIHLARHACTRKRAKCVCILYVCSQAGLSRRRVAFNLNTDFDWDRRMRTRQVLDSSIESIWTWYFFPLPNSPIFPHNTGVIIDGYFCDCTVFRGRETLSIDGDRRNELESFTLRRRLFCLREHRT